MLRKLSSAILLVTSIATISHAKKAANGTPKSSRNHENAQWISPASQEN